MTKNNYRLICFILALCISFGAVMSKPKQIDAFVIADDMVFITGFLLLSMGYVAVQATWDGDAFYQGAKDMGKDMQNFSRNVYANLLATGSSVATAIGNAAENAKDGIVNVTLNAQQYLELKLAANRFTTGTNTGVGIGTRLDAYTVYASATDALGNTIEFNRVNRSGTYQVKMAPFTEGLEATIAGSNFVFRDEGISTNKQRWSLWRDGVQVLNGSLNYFDTAIGGMPKMYLAQLTKSGYPGVYLDKISLHVQTSSQTYMEIDSSIYVLPATPEIKCLSITNHAVNPALEGELAEGKSISVSIPETALNQQGIGEKTKTAVQTGASPFVVGEDATTGSITAELEHADSIPGEGTGTGTGTGAIGWLGGLLSGLGGLLKDFLDMLKEALNNILNAVFGGIIASITSFIDSFKVDLGDGTGGSNFNFFNFFKLLILILISILSLFLAFLQFVFALRGINADSSLFNEYIIQSIEFLKTYKLAGFNMSFHSIVTSISLILFSISVVGILNNRVSSGNADFAKNIKSKIPKSKKGGSD